VCIVEKVTHFKYICIMIQTMLKYIIFLLFLFIYVNDKLNTYT